MEKLRFATANNKLKHLEQRLNKKIISISLLSGWSCPWAKECQSKVVIKNNNKLAVQDGPNIKFRCYSASNEAMYPSVFNNHLHNFTLIKRCHTIQQHITLIENSLPAIYDIVRIHANGGDFFRLNYFKAWLQIAKRHPDKIFYAYTKAIKYWVDHINKIPTNFLLTASLGGTQDNLIKKYSLRYTKVVFSYEEANKLNLPIDHDDSHASDKQKVSQNFALLIHGIMPKGSKAAKARQELLKRGWAGYGKVLDK